MIQNIINEATHHVAIFNFQPYSLDQLLEFLPDKGAFYNTQLDKFSSLHRKREWLAVRVLLYHMIGEMKEISYQESGRPFLADHSYQISISHTRGYAAAIISKTFRVGIDIEIPGEKAMKVAHKFVDDAEFIYPETDQITQAEMYTMVWSAKETMYKCMDSSEILFREELHVDINIPLFEQPYFPAYETHTPRRQKFNIYYLLEKEKFVLNYAVVE